MKKVLLGAALVLFTSFLLPQVSFAQMGMMGGYYNDDASSSSQTQQQSQQKLDTMVNSLLKEQNVSSIKQLDCQKIGSDQLEKLGDAWMDVQIPNESAHQAMDNMMGGEGSQSLNAAHTQMAQRYLGCSEQGTTNSQWMPMMFGGQNNTSRGGGFPMMGYGYGSMMNGSFGWGLGAVGLLFWVVVLIDLILAGVWLWQQIRSKKK